MRNVTARLSRPLLSQDVDVDEADHRSCPSWKPPFAAAAAAASGIGVIHGIKRYDIIVSARI